MLRGLNVLSNQYICIPLRFQFISRHNIILQICLQTLRMYIPSLDMGEYDEYGSGASRRPPVNQDFRNQERDRARNIERQPSRKKLDNMPRLPR